MRYVVYLLVCLGLVGTWLLGLALPVGDVGSIVVTIATMGSLVALVIYYQGNKNE